ncbi:MAG: hypothetical protein AAGE59_33350 [Cyanobacteria bacterium P01_F01_bin.86]
MMISLAFGLGAGLTLSGCGEASLDTFENSVETTVENTLDKLEGTFIVDTYEATATTIYTWQVEYRPGGVTQDRPREGRIETFESSYRVNINGQPATQNSGSADEKGLWWPALPPKPTVDDLEARQKNREVFAEPQIQKDVQYTLAFEEAGQMVTLQTEYSVYREAVKANEAGRPLKLTLGREDAYVWKAEMQ